MNPLEPVYRWQNPETIPFSFSFLPKVWIDMPDELHALAREFPEYVRDRTESPEEIRASMSPRYHAGTWVDEWDCVWSNINEGNDAIVTGHPVPNREDIAGLKQPGRDTGDLPHGFMYLRLLDLRGFEEAMLDFAEECEELDILIEKVLDYNIRQAGIMAAKRPPDRNILYLGDDLGMQTGLAIGAKKWRKYLKPCFTKIFSAVKSAGKDVYFHTDGCIWEIMPDLMECGADILNPQYRANGLDNLVRVCKGKIPIHLDLDRQLFPFATPSELDDHVREAVEALWTPEGGLAFSVELGYDVPAENMAALMAAARKYRQYRR